VNKVQILPKALIFFATKIIRLLINVNLIRESEITADVKLRACELIIIMVIKVLSHITALEYNILL
jgi:hypothetical protein